MPLYRYTIEGAGAADQTWSASGTVETTNAGQFMEVPMQAMSQAFRQVTQGRATYGQPGAGGCRGPYTVTRMVIEDAAAAPRPVHPAENIGSTTRDRRARPLGEVLGEYE